MVRVNISCKSWGITFAPSPLTPSDMALRCGTGMTVLQKAVIQHNILAASLLYKNIALAELATLLQVAPNEVSSRPFGGFAFRPPRRLVSRFAWGMAPAGRAHGGRHDL
jgi:hypothetical protein